MKRRLSQQEPGSGRLRRIFKRAMSTARVRTRQVVLCIGALGKAIPRAFSRLGLGVLCMDGLVAADPDLWEAGVRKKINGWIRGGCVVSLVVGPPPHLALSSARSDGAGDWVFAAYAAILRSAVGHTVPVGLILPAGSRLWHTPGLRIPLRSTCIDIHADTCQWGVRWRSALRIAQWNVSSPGLATRHCSGKAGKCSATGKHHIDVRRSSASATSSGPMAPALAATVAGDLIKAAQDLHKLRLDRLWDIGAA